MTCFVLQLELLRAVGILTFRTSSLTGYFQTVLIVKALVADSDSDKALNKHCQPMKLRGLFSCLETR